MAVLRINCIGGVPQLHGAPAPLAPALAAHDRSGPVIVMVHGFKFLPGAPRHCPHDHIFSDHAVHACRKALSWPRALNLSAEGDGAPLGVAFGWPARGTIWQAHAGAALAGEALARLVSALKARVPERPVHVIAHSLGARVALSALHHLAPGAVGRLILLAGAEHRGAALGALATPAGRRTEVINVTSGENRLYDLALEALIPPPAAGDRALGAGLNACNAIDLRLDDAATLDALTGLGFDVAPRTRRVCHWSSYLRPGVFDLYAALLGSSADHRTGFAALRAALPPDEPGVQPARRPLFPGLPVPAWRNAAP